LKFQHTKSDRALNTTLILFLFSKIFHLYSLLSFTTQPGTLSYFLSSCISLSYQKHSLNHTRISMLRPSMVEDFYAISVIFHFSQQKFSFVLKYQQIHIKRFLSISHFTFFTRRPFQIFLVQISHENRRCNPRKCAIHEENLGLGHLFTIPITHRNPLYPFFIKLQMNNTKNSQKVHFNRV
jgi:hypothetical protein